MFQSSSDTRVHHGPAAAPNLLEGLGLSRRHGRPGGRCVSPLELKTRFQVGARDQLGRVEFSYSSYNVRERPAARRHPAPAAARRRSAPAGFVEQRVE